MSKLRSLSTSFWSDPFIENLTPNQKLLFIYLITNEKTNMLGIYESSISKISFETGINKETILNDLKYFESVGKVKYIKNYVVLVNFLKHQNFNTNMMKSAIDVYNNLPKELKDNNINIDKNNPLKGFETLSNHYGMVRKYEVEVEDEDEDEDEDEIEDKMKEKIKTEMLSSNIWIESICKNKLITYDVCLKYLNTFLNDAELKDELNDLKDSKKHFINWLNIKLKNEPKKQMQEIKEPDLRNFWDYQTYEKECIRLGFTPKAQ